MAVLGEPSGRMRWIGLNKKRDSLTTQLTLRGNEEDKEMETKLVVSLRSGMSKASVLLFRCRIKQFTFCIGSMDTSFEEKLRHFARLGFLMTRRGGGSSSCCYCWNEFASILEEGTGQMPEQQQ